MSQDIQRRNIQRRQRQRNELDRVDATPKGYESLVSSVLTVTIFGATILTTLVSGIADPADLSPNPRFSLKTVRTFLAVSWLLFVLALVLSGFARSMHAFYMEQLQGSAHAWRRKWGITALLFASSLQMLNVSAFFFLALTIMAYVEVVGFIAVVALLAAAMGVLIMFVVQWR